MCSLPENGLYSSSLCASAPGQSATQRNQDEAELSNAAEITALRTPMVLLCPHHLPCTTTSSWHDSMSVQSQRLFCCPRDDMHQRELADLVKRNQAAESRHEELAAALPEATRPLVRQLEAMQAASQEQAAAWAAAEAALTKRAHDAEARAAASGQWRPCNVNPGK